MSRVRFSLSALFRRFWRSTDGAAAVELAILLPTILLFVFGIYEFGRLFWIQSSLQFAVEQAGRWAIANKAASAASIQTQCDNFLANVRLSSVTCNVTTTTITSSANLAIPYNVITANFTFGFVTGLPFSTLTGTTITLRGKSQVPQL